jgi:hypothetical protein
MFSYELNHKYVREVANKYQQGYELNMLFTCTFRHKNHVRCIRRLKFTSLYAI